MLFHFLFIFIFTQVGIWVSEQIPALLPFTLEKKANRSSECIESSFPVIKIANPFSSVSQSFVDIDGSFYKPFLSGHIGFRYIFNPEVNKVFLPEFNKVSFEPFANIDCSLIKPIEHVIKAFRDIFLPEVNKVFFPEVDKVFLPEINKVSFEPLANIFKCVWNIFSPEIDEIILKPVSNVFKDILSLEVCFC